MFILSRYIFDKFDIVEKESQSVFSIASGMLTYTVLYLYILFFNSEYLQIFNSFIFYLIAIDSILAVAWSYLQYPYPNQHPHQVSDDTDTDSDTGTYSDIDTDSDGSEDTDADDDNTEESVSTVPAHLITPTAPIQTIVALKESHENENLPNRPPTPIPTDPTPVMLTPTEALPTITETPPTPPPVAPVKPPRSRKKAQVVEI